MEPPKSEVNKIADMVMCGDHPSFTKTDLNMKETKIEDTEKEKEKVKERTPISHSRITPSSSSRACERARAISEHALLVADARRKVRSLEIVQRPDVDVTVATPQNRALVQAALGSFRWPPYLVAVWVLVLLITHVLHSLVSVLERSLPAIKKLCQYFRTWTEESWKTDTELNHRIYPIALACVTGILYIIYCTLYLVYSIGLWSIEPLCTEVEDKLSSTEVNQAKVTNYIDEVMSKSSSGIKQ